MRKLLATVVAVLAGATALTAATASADMQYHKVWVGDGYSGAPNGLSGDAAGNLYAMGGGGTLVEKFDADGALQNEWPGGAGGITGGWDVATNIGGTLVYVTDQIGNRVQKFDGAGAFLSTFGSGPGSGQGEFNFPRGIDVDSDGNVYVTDSNNSRVQKFDGNGTYISEFDGSATGTAFSGPSWVSTDSDDNVYVSDNGNDRIVVFDSAGTFLHEWGTSGAGGGQFSSPAGTSITTNGDIYVVDNGNARVQKFVRDGADADDDPDFVLQFGTPGTNLGQLINPRGIVASGTTVYVADQNNSRIQKFSPIGTAIGVIKGSGTLPQARFGGPTGVATDAAGHVFVSDSARDSVEAFDTDGVFTHALTSGLDTPTAIAYSPPTTTLMVVNKGTNTLFRVDSETGTVTATQNASSTGLQFNSAGGVAVNAGGAIYVADTGNDRIVSVSADFSDPNTQPLSIPIGSGPGEIQSPVGIAVDINDHLYVTDSVNDRVLVYDNIGSPITEWGGTGSGLGQLDTPTGIALTPNGNVAVVNTGNSRVDLFSTTGVFLDTYGTQGSGIGELDGPASVAFDGTGLGFIVESTNKRVTRFAFSGGLVPIPPKRILDTRTGTGAPMAPIAPQGTLNLDVTASEGSDVPDTGVDAVVMNITATGPTAAGWLTLFPADGSLPTAANLNFVAGQTVPNLVVVKVGHGGANEGKVSINNTGGNPIAGSVNVVADIVGWYSDGIQTPASIGASEFVGVQPTRILDTRAGCPTCQATVGAVAPQDSVTLDIPGWSALPVECASATAAVLNVTATGPTQAGWLTAYPGGDPLPLAANLNFVGGQTVPNLVTVKLGGTGAVTITNTGGAVGGPTVHVIADMVGCYSPPIPGAGYLGSFAPVRILDTRLGTGVPGGATTPVAPHGTITVNPQVAGPVMPPVGGYRGVVVNVTVTQPGQGGWLTAHPSDGPLPNAANLNFVPGQTVPNLVKIKVGADGMFTIENTNVPGGPQASSGTVHVVVDIVGYYQ